MEPGAQSPTTRSEIEEIANNAVRDNLEVTTRILPLDEAKAAGAMALFGEKYGDTVRMVDIGGPWSRELCAGTHVRSSAEIGLVNLVSESSVGLDEPPRRGARRARRVPRPRGRARDRLAAHVDAEDAARAAARAHRRRSPPSLKAAEKKIAAFEATGARRPRARPRRRRRRGRRRTVAVIDDVGELGVGRRPARARDSACASASAPTPAVVALAARVGGKPVGDRRDERTRRATPARRPARSRSSAAAVLGGGGGGKDDLAQGGGTDVVGDRAAALDGIRAALKG